MPDPGFMLDGDGFRLLCGVQVSYLRREGILRQESRFEMFDVRP
jgi:hypothetical protein